MQILKSVVPLLRKRLTFKYDIVAPITATVLVLVSGTFISFLMAQNQVARNKDNQDSYLLEQQQLIADSITQRISAYEQALISGASLFRISGDVNREHWRDYIQGIGVEERFPGTDGLGYLERVSPNELDSFEKRIRSEGLTGYEVWPDDITSEYFPITYVEPLSDTNKEALGFNLYSEDIRRKTLDTARDSGKLAMTPPIATSTDQQQIVVLAFYPVYKDTSPETVAGRRSSLRGFTYVLLRMDGFGDLIGSRFSEDDSYGFRITDTTDGAEDILYTSSQYVSPEDPGDSVFAERELPVLGRTWNIALSLNDERFGADQLSPFLVFTLGMVVNAIGAGFLFMLMVHRQARVAVSHEIEIQKAKDDLLALASHQLRTPATGVKQYVGMMLAGYAGKLTKEQRTMLEKANESNERQLEIINQLLYVAKADAGQLKVDPTRFNVVQLAEDIVSEQKEAAEAKRIKVSVRSRRPLYIFADERHVRMIIENLISNAIKYSYPKGKVEVYFSNWRDRIAVHVSDRGVGISASDMEQLFKKFSRIENKLTKQVGGSGIGLFLAQQLANAHSGEIVVESEPEKGSTFTLSIPKKYKK